MAKILVIDDENSIRATFEIFLTKDWDTRFFWQTRWKRRKKIVSEQELDLIITDIIMPKMTGIDFLSGFETKSSNVPNYRYDGRAHYRNGEGSR